MSLEIQPNQNGLLVDSFKLVDLTAPGLTNYFLPEEPPEQAGGGRIRRGTGALEVVDNRGRGDQSRAGCW